VASAFAQFTFVQVVFTASVAAILLQCAIYLVRHLFGLRAAWIVLRGSLIGFVLIAVGALLVAWRTGDLQAAVEVMGWSPVADFAMFVLFTMFISYFMGDRYLADQEQRTRRGAESGSMPEGASGGGSSASEERA